MSKSVSFAAMMAAAALSCGTRQRRTALRLPHAASSSSNRAASHRAGCRPTRATTRSPIRGCSARSSTTAAAEAAGTIIIDTPHTFLYYVLGNGKALRYGIGVGREGFTWSGVKSIERKAEWPDWYPPAEMLARQPYLPRMTAGGPGNPLGARAMYIGGTQYRIHGTNAPTTIGKHVSSGCIRLTNEDVIDLYNRVHVGAKVIVLPQTSVAKLQHASLGYAYAPQPQTPAQATWQRIRPVGR